MATATQEYRKMAATCLRLSRTMDDNRRRLEDIAGRWLELAKEDELVDRNIWKLPNEGAAAQEPPAQRKSPAVDVEARNQRAYRIELVQS
jgi:hypothetical protein